MTICCTILGLAYPDCFPLTPNACSMIEQTFYSICANTENTFLFEAIVYVRRADFSALVLKMLLLHGFRLSENYS